MKNMELVIGITGASGVIYGYNLLKVLTDISDSNLHLIISKNAHQLLDFETNLSQADLKNIVQNYYENAVLTASIASGSKKFDAMVIVPCTMSTTAKINSGISDNLITRVADVCLKEKRKLIIVPRETPLNSTHLKNLLELSKKGVVVIPAMPAFYHKPKSMEDLIDFITGKILDNLGIDHELFDRWSGAGQNDR